MNKIVILLSTYNGEKYIKEQLDSIFAQNDKEFRLIVRDDGSIDKSYEILQDFAQNTSLHVKLLEDRTNFGVKKSFELLMKEAINMNAQYIMFCDQDDVWLSHKIATTYATMQRVENEYPNLPLLIHSDLSVADKDLHVTANSFWKYQNIDPSKDTLNHLLLHNAVTGCTMMINRALAEKVKTIPQEAIMHDWWIALVASVFGKIDYIHEPLMLYRQHGTNDTGAKNYGWSYFVKKFIERPSLDRYLVQAEMFLNMYEDKLDDNSKKMLLALKHFNSFSKFKKIKVIIKYKLWKNGFMRNIGLLVNA